MFFSLKWINLKTDLNKRFQKKKFGRIGFMIRRQPKRKLVNRDLSLSLATIVSTLFLAEFCFYSYHSYLIICLTSFILVCTRCIRLDLQILKFQLFVFKNQNEYLFGICPRLKTNIKKCYSSVLTVYTDCFFLL